MTTHHTTSSQYPPSAVAEMLRHDAEAVDACARRRWMDHRLTATDTALLTSMEPEELAVAAMAGHPTAFRLAAAAELRRRQWLCEGCGKVQHDEPADYTAAGDPLCRACVEAAEIDRLFIGRRRWSQWADDHGEW